MLTIILTIIWTTLFIIMIFKKRPKVYYLASDEENGWLDIETMEEANVANYRPFLVTNGNEVRETYYLFYNKKGQPVLSLSEPDPITHWRPFPKPPRKK